MKVRFKKLSPNAVIPTKAHPTDAGFDLVATTRKRDEFNNIVYGFGIAVEVPVNHVGLIFPRSSIAKRDLMLTNSVGCVDSSFRGEILAKFKPCFSGRGDIYEVGERIAQLIIMPYPEVEFEEVKELSDSDRGTGGYGSTGK